MPKGFVLGRTQGGKGPPQLIDIASLSATPGSALATGGAPPSSSLPSIADGDTLANTSGGAASPIATTLTAWFDYLFGNPATKGDILYRGAAVWSKLGIGSSGQALVVAAGLPSWSAATGIKGMLPLVTGEVPGPIPVADGNGQFIGVAL